VDTDAVSSPNVLWIDWPSAAGVPGAGSVRLLANWVSVTSDRRQVLLPAIPGAGAGGRDQRAHPHVAVELVQAQVEERAVRAELARVEEARAGDGALRSADVDRILRPHARAEFGRHGGAPGRQAHAFRERRRARRDQFAEHEGDDDEHDADPQQHAGRHPGRHRRGAHDREFGRLRELRHRVNGADQRGNGHHHVQVARHEQQHVQQRVLQHVAALAHRRQLLRQVHERGQAQERHQHEGDGLRDIDEEIALQDFHGWPPLAPPASRRRRFHALMTMVGCQR
jgi:hypothetical protein